MHTKLSIPERLKDLRVVDKHLTLEQLAEQTGLSKSALSKYESDDYKDISPFAIATLAEFYGVSTDYLMGLSENKNHPNTELQALHLSDDMVTLLSSGKINNRLLCEIATHENFQRLMTDIEIFVDRIADMRIAQMNLVLEATRQEVIRSHAPGDNDLYVRTLELGQVQESDFFSHTIHDDLDSIVQDIRQAHVTDRTTADPQPTFTEVKEKFDRAMQLGSNEERVIHEFCDQMQIPFDKIEVQKHLASELEVQFIVATHSPLIMASSEPIFDINIDKLFQIKLSTETADAVLCEEDYIKYGPVNTWLTSPIFNLSQARATGAEEAINAAKNLQLEDEPSDADVQAVHQQLVQCLAQNDPFWPRWIYFAEQHGVIL